MSEQKLDQIVKGAPPPDAKIPTPPSTRTGPQAFASSPASSASNTVDPTDPISTLPSSPPQIYLNLLILEASLRSQYLTLRARRRQHTFFVGLLGLWIAYFFYALFLRPREDGRGVGGSVYWVVEMGEKVALLGGFVTAILMWGTGQWERGIRWPRRWLVVANRGLRGINAKLVIIKGPWWRETLSNLTFLFPFSILSTDSPYADFAVDEKQNRSHRGVRHIEDEEAAWCEEDLTPGGDCVRLLLLPKPFSPEFRENWELYRTEYWERENERRAELRRKLREHQRALAKEKWGWFRWPTWSIPKRPVHMHSATSDKHHHTRRHAERDPKPRRPPSVRSGSQSRGSSRSTTPTLEDEKPERVRRGSTTMDRRKKSKSTASSGSTRPSKLTAVGDRPSSTRLPSINDSVEAREIKTAASAAHTRAMSRTNLATSSAGSDSG